MPGRSKNPKKVIAKKMMSKVEVSRNLPPFHSKNWSIRFRARQQRVLNNKHNIK